MWYNKEMLQQTLSDPITAAYLAGLFDGEGCISVAWLAHNKQYSTLPGEKLRPMVTLSLGQSDFGLLTYVQTSLGVGSINEVNARSSGLRPTKTHYMWQVGGSGKVRYVLITLLPYLRLKQERARLAVSLLDRILSRTGMEGGRLTETELMTRAATGLQIQQLNH